MLSQVFWLLGGLGAPKPCVTDFRAPRGPLVFTKSCVFTGVRAPPGRWGLQNFMFPAVFWLLGAPGGSKIIGFHRFFGSSGGLGDPKPLCFHRCSGSSGTLGAPKTLFSQVFGLLGSPGAPKPYLFTRFLAPRGAWGLQCFHICFVPQVPWDLPVFS